MNPIEGVHYIFDRYAFLNQMLKEHLAKKHSLTADAKKAFLGTGFEDGAALKDFLKAAKPDAILDNALNFLGYDSPQKEVNFAIKQARSLYHPDRINSAGEGVQQEAAKMRRHIEECATILQNEEVRPLYNARLEEFKKTKPQSVSKSGAAIINMAEEYFDLDSILSDEEPDTSFMEEKLAEQTGFSEKKFQGLKAVYDATPDNEAIRDLYKDMLTDKYIYLRLLEGIAWGRLGYKGKKENKIAALTHADTYLNGVKQALAQERGRIIAQELPTRNTALLLGLAQKPLLLTDQRESNCPAAQLPSAFTEDEMAIMQEKIARNFEDRSDFVKQVAAQKQEVLAELVSFADYEWLYKNPTCEEVYIFIVQPDEKQSVVFQLTLERENLALEQRDNFARGLSLDEFRTIVNEDFPRAKLTPSIIAVKRNKEIETFLAEAIWVTENKVTEYFDELDAQNAPSTPKTPPSQPNLS